MKPQELQLVLDSIGTGQSADQLEGLTHYKRAKVQRLLDRLEENGFIERRGVRRSSRGTLVPVFHLTESGTRFTTKPKE